MWHRPLPSGESQWITYNLEDKESFLKVKKIVRSVYLNCPDVFLINEENIKVFNLEGIEDFVIVRVINLIGTLELYGFYSNKSSASQWFHPIDNDNIAFDLLGFLKSKDSKVLNNLSLLRQSFKSYMTKSERKSSEKDHTDTNELKLFIPEASFRVYDNFLPSKNWEYVSDDNANYSNILEHLMSNYISFLNGEDEDLIKNVELWITNLSFSDCYKLIEVIYYSDNFHTRFYALIDYTETRVVGVRSKTINGKSIVFHSIWEEGKEADFPSFVIDTSQKAYDYLKLFCWGLEGDKGRFVLPECLQDMPWVKSPDISEWEKINIRFHNSKQEDQIGDKIEITFNDVVVNYSDAIYHSEFTVNIETGMVAMNNDDRIDGLPLKQEFFVKINTRQKLSGSLINKPIAIELEDNFFLDESWIDILKKRSKGKRKIASEDFLEALRENRKIANKKVKEPIYINDFSKTGTKVSIENCVFEDKVSLINNESKISIEFLDCIFYDSFLAKDIHFYSSLSFQNCVFLSEKINSKTQSVGEKKCIDFHNYSTEGDLEFMSCAFIGTSDFSNMSLKGSLSYRGAMFTRYVEKIFSYYSKRHLSEITNKEKSNVFFLDKVNFNSLLNGSYSILILDNSSVDGDVFISGATTINSSLNECCMIMGSLSSSGIQVGGDLRINNTIIHGTLDFSSSVFNKGVYFINKHLRQHYVSVQIGGALLFNNSRIDNVLNLACINVKSNVSLYGVQVNTYINLFGLRSLGNLDLDFVKVRGILAAYRNSLNTISRETLHIKGNVSLSSADVYNVKLKGIQIEGNVKVYASNFGSFQIGYGLNTEYKSEFDNSTNEKEKTSKNGFRLRPVKSRIKKHLHIESSIIKGILDLSGVDLHTDSLTESFDRIKIEKNTIGGDVLFFDKLALNSLDKGFSKIMRGYHLEGIRFRREYIDDSFPHVKGLFNLNKNVKLLKALKGTGSVLIKANDIGGKLDLRNVIIRGKLDLDDTSVKLSIKMNGYYEQSYGMFKKRISNISTDCQNISMNRAQIGGNLNLTGLQLQKHNYSGGNFSAIGSTINGGIYLIATDSGFDDIESKDQIAHSAFIEGDFDASVSNIKEISFTENNFFKGRIDLERTVIGKLRIIDPTPQKIYLSGIVVKDWDFGGKHNSDKDKKKNISEEYLRVLNKMVVFDKSVYLDIEKELRNRNEEKEANKVYIAMKKEAIKQSKIPWYSPIIMQDRIYGLTTQYGTNFWILLWIWFGLVAVFTGLMLIFKIGNLSPVEVPLFAIQNCIPIIDLDFIEYTVEELSFKYMSLTFKLLSYLLLSIAVIGLSVKVSRVK
jgi:hypothetical protein